MVLVRTAEEGFGPTRGETNERGTGYTLTTNTTDEQGRFWQGFRSRLGARLGTLAYGVRAEPSARVTNQDWWLRHMGLFTCCGSGTSATIGRRRKAMSGLLSLGTLFIVGDMRCGEVFA